MVYRKIHLASSAALLSAITVGIACTYSSTATESMKNGKLNPNLEEISWIGSILPLGAILGGIIAGFLSEKIGRKGVMMYQSVLLVAGWVIIACAKSLLYVYIGRFITGVCCGLICVVIPMYIAEISTAEIRGEKGSGFQVFICSGIILSSITGKFLSWERTALIGAGVAAIAVLAMLCVPESPRWLITHEQHADAIHAVNYLYGSVNEPSVNQLVSEAPVSQGKISSREIFQPQVYKPAVLSIMLMFFQQFSGSNAILFYTVSIFKQASSSLDPNMGFLWVALVMYLSTMVAGCTVDKIGRKMCLYLSGFVSALSLNGMSIYLVLSERDPSLKHTAGFVPLICLLVFITAFSLGFGPLPWVMMSEMAPLKARGLVCGIGTAFSWIFCFIVTKTFQNLVDLVGDFGAYWIYSGFGLCSCFFVYFFLPETKGKTLEEIEDYFAGGDAYLQRLDESPTDRFTDRDGQ